MQPAAYANKRRASSPVAIKNGMVRSRSNNNDKPISVSVRRQNEPEQVRHHEPLYHHQSTTVAYLSSLPPSNLEVAMRHRYSQPARREIIVESPDNTEFVDLRFDIRIRTPKRQRPTVPYLFDKFEQEKLLQRRSSFYDSQGSIKRPDEVVEYRIVRPPVHEELTAAKSESIQAKYYELCETRIVESRQLLHSVKCSVCSSNIPASDIDRHYEHHSKMFYMYEHGTPERTPQKPPKTNSRIATSRFDQPVAQYSCDSLTRSVVVPSANPQARNDSVPYPTIMTKIDRYELKEVFLTQEQQYPRTPLYIPPSANIETRLNHGKSQAKRSNMSIKKIQLTKDLIRNGSSNMPEFSIEQQLEELQQEEAATVRLPTSNNCPPSNPSSILQNKLAHFNYKYEREVPIRCKTNDSVLSRSSSYVARSKLPLNILAQNSSFEYLG